MVADDKLLSSFDVEEIAPEALLFQTGYLTIEETFSHRQPGSLAIKKRRVKPPTHDEMEFTSAKELGSQQAGVFHAGGSQYRGKGIVAFVAGEFVEFVFRRHSLQ